jgi:glycosyltransferase involved in cell wall biosynthesis
MVFNHEIFYFLPEKDGQSFYENVRLFPYEGQPNGEAVFAYEMMKKCGPHLVISIGHYNDAKFINEIKSLYPYLFKWIVVVTSGSRLINEKAKNALDYADHVIALNKGALGGLQGLLTKPVSLVPYGPSDDFFDKGENRGGVLASCKNSQIANVPAFLDAMRGTNGSIHYNANDEGFYDIPLLNRRFKCENDISVPDKFVSVREGLTDIMMNDLYNRHGVFVDCSMQCATSISMLEAMRTGCIPVAVNTGASKDILSMIPEEYRFLVEGEVYIGENSEDYTIVPAHRLREVIQNVLVKLQNKDWEQKARNTIKHLSRYFSKDNFLQEINTVVQDTIMAEESIVVDSLVQRN